MKTILSILAICLLLALPSPTLASIHKHHLSDDGDGEDDADTNPDPADEAHDAANVAKQAAKVANKVANHSIEITGHAKKALHHALGALHDARVDTTGLKEDQKASLKKAEAHLREATKKADYGELKKVKDERDLQKEKMKQDLDKKESKSQKEELLQEVEELRQKLSGKKGKKKQVKHLNKALDELEADIEKGENGDHDETTASLEGLREDIAKLEDAKENEDSEEKEHAKEEEKEHAEKKEPEHPPTPVEEKGIDIDTAMPYGDLEPFGREDTAQELTESSIKESDSMVDQLERAEVAEEKRAVFRALTRLRGAAITSYDGVARAQTGNIDEYGKTHKWRNVHPLHHLADEESDISKWAFPDNADFLQKKP